MATLMWQFLYGHSHTWSHLQLNLQKPPLKAQELKSILYPHMNAILMHYPEMQNIWSWMARSAFIDGFLTTL